MIEQFCSRLPGDISRPMYNEYYNRLREIQFIIENREAYFLLKDDQRTIEMIVALSIFYKRVIANIKGATTFAATVFDSSSAQSVKIGDYDLTDKERRRILATIINFQTLTAKYNISRSLITTVETRDLIRKIKDLKIRLERKDNPKQDESL